MTAQTLPQQVVDDILSDLARGYRSTMAIASRHRVSVAVVEELRKTGGRGAAAPMPPESAAPAAPEPTVGGDAPVVEVPAYGVAVEPDAAEPAAPPTVADARGAWTDGLTAEERAECRAWCKANGVKVTASGRIARPVVAQWRAASSSATTDEVEGAPATPVVEVTIPDATASTVDAPVAPDFPEPACLIHDTSGEDVRGWEMAECTCPPAERTPIPRCRCSHVQGWHANAQDACHAAACGCTQFRDAESEPCPTCSGPIRETVGMVCQTCGTDYAKTPNSVATWVAGMVDADPVALHPDPVQPDATEPRPDLRDLLRAAVTEVDARLDFAITHAPDAVEQLITACGEFVEWTRTIEEAVRRVDAVESRLREAAETGELTDGDLRSLAEALVKVADAA